MEHEADEVLRAYNEQNEKYIISLHHEIKETYENCRDGQKPVQFQSTVSKKVFIACIIAY